MTTVHIEDSTPEGRWLLDLIKDHKSVTIEPKKKETKTIGAWDVAIVTGAVSLEEFNTHFETEIRKVYGQ